jgi:photosystem II stability/assembly factor-like uncharacterized protein
MAPRLVHLRMIDPAAGWSMDDAGHILRTSDGRETWEDVSPPQGAYVPGGFFALDSQAAWATPHQPGCYTLNCPEPPASASIWRTQDGGLTWVQLGARVVP